MASLREIDGQIAGWRQWWQDVERLETCDNNGDPIGLGKRPVGADAHDGADVSRAMRWRISPNLTWYPSEFSKIRLQYNYDDRDLVGVDHSVWLQFEFLLGAHAAHKF